MFGVILKSYDFKKMSKYSVENKSQYGKLQLLSIIL